MGTFNPPPEGQVDREIIPRGLDQLFNQYMAMKQGQRQETELAGQQQLRQQQLEAGRGAAALQNVQQTAQFGAPLASYTPEQISRAGQGIQPQGPGLPPDQARLQRLVEGMTALRTQQGQAGRLAEANILGEEEGARLKGATADLYARGGAIPGQGGPEIVTKDGQQFIANRDLRGNVRYTPNTGAQIQSEVGTKIGLAQDGLANLEHIESVLKSPKGRELAVKAGGSFAKLKSLGDPDAEILANAIFQASDSEARVKTGAAINEREVEEYFRSLVNPVGTMAGNIDRIGRKKAYFNGQMAIYGQGRNIPGRQAATQTGGGPVADPLGLFK